MTYGRAMAAPPVRCCVTWTPPRCRVEGRARGHAILDKSRNQQLPHIGPYRGRCGLSAEPGRPRLVADSSCWEPLQGDPSACTLPKAHPVTQIEHQTDPSATTAQAKAARAARVGHARQTSWRPGSGDSAPDSRTGRNAVFTVQRAGTDCEPRGSGLDGLVPHSMPASARTRGSEWSMCIAARAVIKLAAKHATTIPNCWLLPSPIQAPTAATQVARDTRHSTSASDSRSGRPRGSPITAASKNTAESVELPGKRTHKSLTTIHRLSRAHGSIEQGRGSAPAETALAPPRLRLLRAGACMIEKLSCS